MKHTRFDPVDESGIRAAGEPCAHTTAIVRRAPGAQVVSLAEVRKASEGPPWERVESYLQSGKPSERLGDWQHRSPAFASALRVLESLEWPAGEPRPTAARSSKRAPSCLLRPPPGRQGDDER